MKVIAVLFAICLLLATPGLALAQNYGQVTRYNADTFRTYGQDGGRLSIATPVSDLPGLPATIRDVQPNGRLGILAADGQLIFVRGMDVEFTLNAAGQERIVCRPTTSNNRAAGAIITGQRAGGGSSADCLVGSGQ